MSTSRSLSERNYTEEKMMFSCTKGRIQNMHRFFTFAVLLAFLGLSLGACTTSTSEQKEFNSPSEAIQAFVTALKTDNDKELVAILGPEANELLFSGDEATDLERKQKFLESYEAQNRIAPDGDRFICVIGKNDWPFPIPLVNKGGRWVFDSVSGKEEILDRRIGHEGPGR
jgi:hypothetical protein